MVDSGPLSFLTLHREVETLSSKISYPMPDPTVGCTIDDLTSIISVLFNFFRNKNSLTLVLFSNVDQRNVWVWPPVYTDPHTTETKPIHVYHTLFDPPSLSHSVSFFLSSSLCLSNSLFYSSFSLSFIFTDRNETGRNVKH